MNRILPVLCCFLFFTIARSQTVPPAIPYQAIARNAAGQALANTPITVQFRIYNTLAATSPSYQEAHAISTNALGYFNVNIGTGTIQSGAIGAVTWSTGNVSYEIWLDTGSGLAQLGGRSAFLSVPYALFSGNSSATPAPTITINSPNSVTSPSAGNYSITVPSPSLALNSNQLSISNGNTVTLPAGTVYVPGAGIAISSGSVITNTAPDQTVTISGPYVTGAYPNYTIAASPLSTVAAGSNVTVTQLGNTYTVNAVPSLSLTGQQLSISNGNSVTLPVGITYTPGPGIGISSGSVITNTAPNQTVSITGPGVTGAYPNYVITPAPPTVVVPGTNVTVNQSGNTYTVNAVTPTLTGNGNATVLGTYPNQTINVPPASLSYTPGTNMLALTEGSNVNTVTLATPPAPVLNGTGLATVANAAPNYTVNVPTPNMGFNNATGTYTYTQGAYSNTINLSPNTAFSSGTLTVGSNTAIIPGTGIWSRNTGTVSLTNPTDNVGIGIATPAERLVVSGNVAIPAANQYKYLTPKTGHYQMSSYAFNPEGTYHRQSLAGGVYITDGSAGVQGNLYAGVFLPDGAIVATLDAYVVDNDGTGGHDIDYAQLWRNDGAVGSGFGNGTNMAQTNGTSTTSSVITKLTTSSITAAVIDNTNYSYYVRIGTRQAAPNLMIFKVVITYTITGVE